jgi:hypothetical protein
MTKGYLGWCGVIKLAKELGYSWQEACEVLYRKKILLFLKQQSLIEKITAVLFIGAIRMNLSIKVN